ncbi:hypothetical protein FDT66_11275 [Polaribacter aestuariivivens]|uniref:Uncharacterized protein n=1 Tax=Polaribacter aestuariivivens TaxID=2304626 RepID=A0A5S3N9R9_9FLAO|nr:hypothetical protein [Polaribacter aestuariivivens]TMM29686.1 hypothetical protein FDT66_11275 [Polaribacter aestuariivivens]
MKILGEYIKDKKLKELSTLINKRIWLIKCSNLGANLKENIYTSNLFEIPFFWKNEFGIEQSKKLEFQCEWNEEEETLIDYYNLKIKVAEREKFAGNFENILTQNSSSGINSNISFSEFIISKILILSREEVADQQIEIRHDEGILFIDKNGNKILLSAEIKCTGQVEFINNLSVINNRIKELKIRKTLGNTV